MKTTLASLVLSAGFALVISGQFTDIRGIHPQGHEGGGLVGPVLAGREGGGFAGPVLAGHEGSGFVGPVLAGHEGGGLVGFRPNAQSV
jgi:hypothetical protein